MTFSIVRDDGHYYLGTLDSKPLFGHGENAASYDTREAAEPRADALRDSFPNRTFEIEED